MTVTRESRQTPAGITPTAVAVGVTALLVALPRIPIASPEATRFTGLLVAAAVWLWALAFEPSGFSLRRSPLLLPGAAVLAAACVSAGVSKLPAVAFTWGAEGDLLGIPSVVALVLVLVLASASRATPSSGRATSLALVWAVPTAAVALFEAGARTPAGAGFANTNYLAVVLCAVWPLALVEAARTRDPRLARALRVGAALIVIAVLVGGSMAGVAGLAVQLALLPFLLPEAFPLLTHARRALAGVIAAALTAGVALVGWWIASGGAIAAPLGGVAGRLLGPSVLMRGEMWRMALAMWRDQALLGVGPDGFHHASQAYLSRFILEQEAGRLFAQQVLVRDPHSLPLLILASGGLVGSGAVLWLGVAWIRAFRTTAVRSCTDERTQRAAYALGLAGALVVTLAVPWSVHYGALLALLGGLAAAPLASPAPPLGSESPSGTSKSLRVALAVVVSAVALSLGGSAILGDMHLLNARRAQGAAAALVEWRAGLRVQPTRAYLEYETLFAEGYVAAQADPGGAGLAEFRTAVDSASPRVRTAGYYLAPLVQIALDAGEGRAQEPGDLAWERAVLDDAAEASPLHPEVLLERAHLDTLTGDYAAASASLEQARSFAASRERFIRYEALLAQARAGSGGVQSDTP